MSLRSQEFWDERLKDVRLRGQPRIWRTEIKVKKGSGLAWPILATTWDPLAIITVRRDWEYEIELICDLMHLNQWNKDWEKKIEWQKLWYWLPEQQKLSQRMSAYIFWVEGAKYNQVKKPSAYSKCWIPFFYNQFLTFQDETYMELWNVKSDVEKIGKLKFFRLVSRLLLAEFETIQKP